MEEMAEINLNKQKVEYFLPRFTCGKREGKVIFPGYIFIKPKTGDSFQSIRSTRRVSDFVRLEVVGNQKAVQWDIFKVGMIATGW